MKVIEYANGEPQVYGALSARNVAATGHPVRPAMLIATPPLPPGPRSRWAERANLLTRDAQSKSASRPKETAQWLDESHAPPFKVLALSLVCASVGPLVGVLLFVLVNNHWG